jgi:hypothetical protein
MADVTTLRMIGGETIRVELGLDVIRNALQEAIAEGQLLELERSDGQIVVVNPASVQYLQNTVSGEPGPAHPASSVHETAAG